MAKQVGRSEAQYQAARATAQAKADATGFDVGLEWNSVYGEFTSYVLPQRQNRYGHELRCEVVSCTDLARCQVGHGPAHPFMSGGRDG